MNTSTPFHGSHSPARKGNTIKLRKATEFRKEARLFFWKKNEKSLRNLQKRLDKSEKVCGRFY